MEQAGRLELVHILNESAALLVCPLPNFNHSPDGPDRKALAGLTAPSGNAVWRFLDLAAAKRSLSS